MSKYAILFILGLTACAYTNTSVSRTLRGTFLHMDTAEPQAIEQVDKQITYTIQEFARHGQLDYYQLTKRLPYLHIHFVNQSFFCTKPESPLFAYCKGNTEGDKITIKLTDSACIANTSLAHEMVHWLLWEGYHKRDTRHQREDLWGPNGVVEKAQAKARRDCQ